MDAQKELKALKVIGAVSLALIEGAVGAAVGNVLSHNAAKELVLENRKEMEKYIARFGDSPNQDDPPQIPLFHFRFKGTQGEYSLDYFGPDPSSAACGNLPLPRMAPGSSGQITITRIDSSGAAQTAVAAKDLYQIHLEGNGLGDADTVRVLNGVHHIEIVVAGQPRAQSKP